MKNTYPKATKTVCPPSGASSGPSRPFHLLWRANRLKATQEIVKHTKKTAELLKDGSGAGTLTFQ